MVANASPWREGRRAAFLAFSLAALRRVTIATVLAAAALLPAADLAPAASLDDLIAQCAACHDGDKGRPPSPEIPALGGQPELFVLYQLVYFRQGVRKETVMNDLVQALGDADLRALASYVATLAPPAPPDGVPDPARYRRGAALAKRHRCSACHNADFSGREQMPRLAGQQEQYLLKAMKQYKAGDRIGILAAMAEVLSEVDDVELQELAHYLAYFRQ